MAIISITPSHLDLLVANLIRDPQVLRIALDKLQPIDFSFAERAYAVVWASVRDHYKEHGLVPGAAILRSDIVSRVSLNPDWMSDPVLLPSVCDILDSAFALPEQYLAAPLAREVLQKILDERQFRRAVTGGDHMPVADLISQINESFARTRLSGARVICPFDLEDPDVMDNNTAPRIATGQVVFDELMCGGPREGEVVVVLGPIGGGKTLLTLNTAIEAAQTWDQHVLFLTYEQSFTEIKERAWVAATKLPRSEIEGRSTSDMRPSTRDRLKQAALRMQKLMLVDMFEPGVGHGGVPEIEALVQNMISEGRRPAMVVIDWLGMAVGRWLGSGDGEADEFKFRHSLEVFCAGCKELAKKFNICVILAHQLNAENGSKPVTAQAAGYSSSGSRMLGTVAAAVINIGTRDPEQNLMKISTTKCRGGSLRSLWCKTDPDRHSLAPQGQEYGMTIGRDGTAALVPRNRMTELGTVRVESRAIDQALKSAEPAVAPVALVGGLDDDLGTSYVR